MNIQKAIHAVINQQDLSRESMQQVMEQIMTGQASAAQIGGFLVGLRMKGETVDEIASAAKVMRQMATRVHVDLPNLVDTCGTGGDAAVTFNISTCSAFVAAAGGAHVAKHGNRSVSSQSGSADVLECAGVRLDLNALQVAACIEQIGIGFMFAPLHHGAMKHALGPRKELATATIFNLLGPLTNPAAAPSQVLGVFGVEWVVPMARVLRLLGSEHVMVVHAEDGMDELSIAAPTRVAELRGGEISSFVLTPEELGLERGDTASLKVANPQQSLALMEQVFANRAGPAQEIVVLNAGAALYTAGVTDQLAKGVARAREVIASGEARKKFSNYVQFTNSFN